MKIYQDYKKYFNNLNINEKEANALFVYLTELVEIVINNFDEEEMTV